MNRIIFYIVFMFFAACSEEQVEIDIPESINSDFRLEDDMNRLVSDFSSHTMLLAESGKNQLMFSSTTLNRNLIIELWNGFKHQTKCRPYIITKNGLGQPIDTLLVGDSDSYNGTDSWYSPLLEINTDRTIVLIENSTSTYALPCEELVLESGEKVIVAMAKTCNVIKTDIYQIKMDGSFELIDAQYTSEEI